MFRAPLRFSFCSRVMLGSVKNAAQSVRETIHCAHRIIGWHVFYLGAFAGSFFQHVCGNSEPVSAV
jgi:hypothetical protein